MVALAQYVQSLNPGDYKKFDIPGEDDEPKKKTIQTITPLTAAQTKDVLSLFLQLVGHSSDRPLLEWPTNCKNNNRTYLVCAAVTGVMV